MLTQISAWAGLAGVGVALIAYLPQIAHLVREHCSAGISAMAYLLWLVSSVLITFHAVVIGDIVFTVLGSVQIIASLLIFLFGMKYRGGVCASHARVLSSQLPESGPAKT